MISSKHIPSSEICLPTLHADPLGFVFEWHGRLFRGIYKESVKQVENYFSSGFLDEVCDKKLFPKTWKSEYENEQFGLILEHERLTPFICATDWNFEQLKDAALMVLEIAGIAWKYGYNMIDCHKTNVLFCSNRPYYVDLGSFVLNKKGSAGWWPYIGFLEGYYYILKLWHDGATQLAKRQMAQGVVLPSAEYMVYQHHFFRGHLQMLKRFLIFRNSVHYVATCPDDKLEKFEKMSSIKWKVLHITKRCLTFFHIAPRPPFRRIVTKIQRMECLKTCNGQSSLPLEIMNTMKMYLKNEQSYGEYRGSSNEEYNIREKSSIITCINFPFTWLKDIINTCDISSINSIQEDIQYSNYEYNELKMIGLFVNSLCFKLINGEVIQRNSFPEKRLGGDWTLLFQNEGISGKFGINNLIVLLKVAFRYSCKVILLFKTIDATDGGLHDRLLDALSIEYTVLEEKNVCLDGSTTLWLVVLVSIVGDGSGY